MFTGKRRNHTKNVPFTACVGLPVECTYKLLWHAWRGKPWCNGILIGMISCVLTV